MDAQKIVHPQDREAWHNMLRLMARKKTTRQPVPDKDLLQRMQKASVKLSARQNLVRDGKRALAAEKARDAAAAAAAAATVDLCCSHHHHCSS